MSLPPPPMNLSAPAPPFSMSLPYHQRGCSSPLPRTAIVAATTLQIVVATAGAAVQLVVAAIALDVVVPAVAGQYVGHVERVRLTISVPSPPFPQRGPRDPQPVTVYPRLPCRPGIALARRRHAWLACRRTVDAHRGLCCRRRYPRPDHRSVHPRQGRLPACRPHRRR